jgi:hypothetical protein
MSACVDLCRGECSGDDRLRTRSGFHRGFAAYLISRQMGERGGLIKAGNRKPGPRGEAHKLAARSWNLEAVGYKLPAARRPLTLTLHPHTRTTHSHRTLTPRPVPSGMQNMPKAAPKHAF